MSKKRKGPVAQLKEKVGKLEQECAEYKDHYLRAAADFENYRRRVQREFELVRQTVTEGLLTELLPVLDNFDRAIAAGCNDASNETLRKGVELIHRQLKDVLAHYGLEEFSCMGEEFDPRRAEATSFVNTDGHEADVVVEEHYKGYTCYGKVIRPARVVVARPSQQSAAREEEGKEVSESAAEEDSGTENG
ncbi:nucleotide exchange factor GrpE [candidate division WOR-3 bacterium JGI_Cruoil_03_51_56]|uniref:Protein GrpE n=1 Tax=candidate division WOR-3 bacterium JGI_Cruoil_03_51_56 TaxID=1973747 RepID=A0A235BPQ6_UNCW3|nr:MAG: nucleotide exchange factor GrpE [candidate division WOR-3 bacterium JGI_Cruoil_03_51_56]